MGLEIQSDAYFMKQALREAQQAFDEDEVPVGAVVSCEGRIIARAHNLTERLNDVTAHAEMQVITAASDFLGGKYLQKCTLYVSLEPCIMCAGAMAWAQLGKLIFGAYDERKGFTTFNQNILHPKTIWTGGLMGEDATELLQRFFRSKRKG